MATGPGFVIDSDWYWRIFEGDARFGDAAGATAARDFLRPLAGLAKDQVTIDQIAIDSDGDGVTFRLAERPVAIRCRGLRVEQFVEAINRSFVEAKLELAFAIVAARRYELRGVLMPTPAALARGTLPG